MQKTATTSRFLIDLSSSGQVADSESALSPVDFVQHILVNRLGHAANARQLFIGLAKTLIRVAEHSFALRDITKLQEASRALAKLPLTEAKQIGRYYQALALSRVGQSVEALTLLETAVDNAPLVYRARAIQTLGSIYHGQGRYDEALHLYPEAMRAASSENSRDTLTALLVNLEISCIKSECGEHHAALTDLERICPLVRIVGRENPLYFYFYHNELAVEFAQLGRLDEAKAASAIALASPFASAYPEWSATRDEIS